MDEELEWFVELLNCFLRFKWQEGFLPRKQTLYNFCRCNKELHYKNWAFMNVNLTVEQMRSVFAYVREKNYELFKKFYEWDLVIYEKGEFIDGWQ